MGSLVVLASHAGNEILGAARMMADAFVEGERVGVVVFADSKLGRLVQCPATSTQMQRTVDCQSVLQELLGEVPPLLVLSYPPGGLCSQENPDLAEDSMLGGFLQSIDAETLLVTDPGQSDPAYEAALGLASRIIKMGLAERLVIVPLGEGSQESFRLGAWGDRASIGQPSSRGRNHRHQFGSLTANYSEESAVWASADKAARFSGIADAVGDRWYPDILEIGCSPGDITPMLAAHCSQLVTVDPSHIALEHARLRVGGAFNVELRLSALSDDLPDRLFDLILLNDCLKDIEFADLAALSKRLPLLCKEGCRIVIAIRHEGAAQEMTAQVATELLMTELAGWAVVNCDKRERSQIHVLERR
jgi:SAM-dependent methyltransferase